MAQIKTAKKAAKRKKSVRAKVKRPKSKRAIPKMTRKEHEQSGHSEPMMASGNSRDTTQLDERARQLNRDNPQLNWQTPVAQTRQGNTQQQWTERVAEGQRNPEPAPSEKEGEPEES
jgi:hypothetical protein